MNGDTFDTVFNEALTKMTVEKAYTTYMSTPSSSPNKDTLYCKFKESLNKTTKHTFDSEYLLKVNDIEDSKYTIEDIKDIINKI